MNNWRCLFCDTINPAGNWICMNCGLTQDEGEQFYMKNIRQERLENRKQRYHKRQKKHIKHIKKE